MTNIEIVNQLKKLEQERLELTALKYAIEKQCVKSEPIPSTIITTIQSKTLKRDLAFALKSPYSKFYEYHPLMDHINDRLDVIISIMSTLAHKINI